MELKKLTAMLLLAMLLVGAAGLAAEWPDGRSPAQPYENVPKVDLDKTMGYIVLYPRAKFPAEYFCDMLEMYLPRQDITLGTGSVRLMAMEGETEREEAAVDVADGVSVKMDPLDEESLKTLKWGEGVRVRIKLPVSLRFDQAYSVYMDEGCLLAADGKVRSLLIDMPHAWEPVLKSDFGVGGLMYSAPQQSTEGEDGEEAEPQADAPYKVVPSNGDTITFDLVMGGDAKFAVIYSDNGSVEFPVQEYSESCTVTGRVIYDNLDWGVVFLDESGEMLQADNLSGNLNIE